MGTGVDAAERLKRDVGALLEAGRAVARDYGAAGGSLRRLILADLALARVALIRGLVFLLLCVIMVGTAWVTAMVLLVVALNQSGLSLLWSLFIPLLASLAVAGVAWGVARKALALADMDATRRQLAAWFPQTSTTSPPNSTIPPSDTAPPAGEPEPAAPAPEDKDPDGAAKAA